MTIIKQHRNKAKYYNLLLIFLFLCFTVESSVDYTCKPDRICLSWLKEIGINTNRFNEDSFNCVTIYKNGDTTFLREYYSKDTYFEGKLINNRKAGVWKGYYKKRKVVETAYLGEEKIRPIYVELWSKRGKQIRFTKFNTID